MDRGLRAQLSPNERATLKRIMSGSPQDDLRGPDVAQLVALQLVEGHNGGWRLTEVGRRRMARDVRRYSRLVGH